MNFLESLYGRIAESFPGAPASVEDLHVFLSTDHPVLYAGIQEFRMHYETWHFIANDRDLKLKAADIWKDQKEVFESTMTNAWEEVLELAQEKQIKLEGLDPLAEPDWLAEFRKSFPEEGE